MLIPVSYGGGVSTSRIPSSPVPAAAVARRQSPRSAAALTALFAALLTALFLFAAPSPAAAHDTLVGSDPAADSTVETLPEAMTLTFSADLIPGDGATAVEVTDAAGTSVIDGAPQIEGATVTQALASATAEAGEYRVTWRVVSSDGHPISGEFAFTVTTGTVPASPTPDADETTTPSATETAVPDAEETAAAETEEPEADEPDSAIWIWVGVVAAVLVVAAIIIWLSTRRRRTDQTTPRSDGPAEG